MHEEPDNDPGWVKFIVATLKILGATAFILFMAFLFFRYAT